MKSLLSSVVAFCMAANVGHTEDKLAPLAGQIWGVSEEQFVSFETMRASLLEAQYILLGERHGRNAHQRRQAFVVMALAEAGKYPTVAFEMLDYTQTATVKSYRAKAPEYALELGIDLNWADTNWPSWSFYAPVFDAAFATKANIVGADLTDPEQKQALAGLSDIKQTTPNQSTLDYYTNHMKKAHCDLITEERANNLANLQLARDVHMTRSMIERADKQHGTILMVGSAHVRKSVGIPRHFPNQDAVVVTMVETDAQVGDFLTPFQDSVAAPLSDFDYIWFTPKLEKTSLCNRLKPIQPKDP